MNAPEPRVIPPALPEKSETARREEAILSFWREDKTFEKSLAKKAPQGEFVFYDGPPFATGLPHHGSLLSSIVKDVVPRYKTMRGYHVRRRWGWDTHGLPIESLVEKELGLKTKKDILDIGIAAFNQKARSMVLNFVGDWERYVERVGRWVDFSNSYKTMDNSYIESVWWGLSQLWEKKLLYEGRKVLMYCPHCETPLAKAEIAMDNTYKDITEEAVTVRFKIKRPSQYGLPENTSFLAWTTTPWTLPGNVALAVNPSVDYVIVPEEGGVVILAASRLDVWKSGNRPKVMVDMGKSYKGAELVGIEYEPLFDIPAISTSPQKKYVVLPADFVTTDEGTGIVHTAVMYGEDDFVLGQKEGLPQVQLLNPNGTYTDDVKTFSGMYIKEAERHIKSDLERRGLLFSRQNNTHSYPHCYRCGTPLIYNAVSSWFINIQSVKEKMLAENEKVHWVPEHLQHGRFGKIVESAPDWTISRNRFWASPLPIWREKNGTRTLVIGSLEELRRHAKTSGNHFVVLRHGEAENNARNILNCKDRDAYGLTEAGKERARSAAKHLSRESLIFTSPVRRARETAEIIADELGVSREAIVTDERLTEFDFGEFDEKSFEEFARWREKTTDLGSPIPGGESYLDAKKRFSAFIADVDARETGKTIIVVSHGIASESLKAAVVGADETASWRIIRGEKQGYAESYEFEWAQLPRNDRLELDLHRPYIDTIILRDDEGREYERIPEVVDCWVESGSMPFAEYHYPFENQAEFKKRPPGDFIAEYIAQTRTWFYYMHALGVLLFDRQAFKTVVTTGTILAADGEKISKSKRNYTDPLELIDRYGSDALRLYLMGSTVMQAEDVRFRDEDVRDAHNRVIQILWNTSKFFELYAHEYDGRTNAAHSKNVLDRWIIARLRECVRDMTEAYDAYDTPRVARLIKGFVEDYSTWYVRRSRDRMKNEGSDRRYALATQRKVLETFSRLIAPIMPFIAESIYRGIGNTTSVHLSGWPHTEGPGMFERLFRFSDEDVLVAMNTARRLVSEALMRRSEAGVKVRQPLAALTIRHKDALPSLWREVTAIIAEEVNVKEIKTESGGAEDFTVSLDTNITPALREEGEVRELIRSIQDARKKAGLKQGDVAELLLRSSAETETLARAHEADILKQTGSAHLRYERAEALEVLIV